jgi:TRAP-type C4-dicarboxylate transport system permease small subunit
MNAGTLPLAARRPHALIAALDAVTTALQWLGAAILAALFVLVMTSVALRYGFGSGLIWSEELAIWLNVLLVAVGAPVVLTGPLAMRLDVIVQFLPASLQKAARVIADGIAIDAGLILVFGGVDVVAAIGGTSTVLGLPEWLRYAAVATGGGLMVLMLFGRTLAQDGIARALLVLAVGAENVTACK